MTGTLGLFSLVDLFQLLAGAGRTGRLLVEHPAGRARVYFDHGRAVHADFAGLEGVDAVYALFADERGRFEFRVGLPAPTATIELGTENLVLEAVRRLDETRRDEDQDADPDLVPEVVDAEAAGALSLQQDERRLLHAADGRRTLERVAAEAGLTVPAAARVAKRLVAVGALRLQRRRARTARLVVRATRERIPPDTAGIDPAILDGWQRALGGRTHAILCKREDGALHRFRVRPTEGAGPYLQVSREALLRSGLVVDQVLLVRPQPEAEGA